MRLKFDRCGWIGDDLSDDFATTLHHSKDCGFADTASSLFVALVEVFVLFESAEIAFVHFDFARQFWTVIFIEHRSNPVEHAPRAFVGDAKLAFQLLCADAASRRCHQVHGVEPELQGRGGILEDRADHRMFMPSTELAAIGRASLGAMMLGHLLAFWAEDAVRIQPSDQLFKASGIVGILALKLHQRVRAIRNARTDWFIPVDLAHNHKSTRCRYIRQGDTYPREACRVSAS